LDHVGGKPAFEDAYLSAYTLSVSLTVLVGAHEPIVISERE